jgi:pimeloyl-ACP methyl ester carboxylesterase
VGQLSAVQAAAGTTPPIAWLEPPQSTPCAEAVVFVHGLGGSAEGWEALFGGFDRPFRLLSLEMPWSGTRGSGWSARSSADWIRSALAAIDAPVFMLVAHSFGANAVLEYLDRHGSGGVERLVLVSPFYDAARAEERVEERFSLQNFEELLKEGFRRAQGRREVPPDILTAMARRIRQRVGVEGWAEFVRVFGRSSRLRTERMEIPTMLVTGCEDRAAPPQTAAALAAAMPCCRLVRLPRCGHFAMTERPDALLRALNGFAASPSTHSPGSDLWATA